jgi:thiamine-phosphate pyrophosphorylase
MPGFHRKISRSLPKLWLFTDERIDTDALIQAVRRLPRGSGIIFRHYSLQPQERFALFLIVRTIARRRGLTLLLAGSWRLALRWKADGWHGRGGRRYSGRRPLLHSTAVHNGKERDRARRDNAGCIFVSPVFQTRSHESARPIGPLHFARIARLSGVATFALGGMTPQRARRLIPLGAQGWGAIDALSKPLSRSAQAR